MSISIWVLLATVYNGHLNNMVVPTLEFTSKEKCEAAIVTIKRADVGTTNLYCVRIEK